MSGKKTWEQTVTDLRQDPSREDLAVQCYFDDPLSASAERFYTSEEWTEVKRLLHGKIPGRILDVGAGRGIASYAFAKDLCRVTALEPDESPIVGARAIKSLCKESKLNIAVVESVVEAAAMENESFDVVYGRAVLHHIKDVAGFFKAVKRILVNNGVFLFTREHVISQNEDLHAFLRSHPLHGEYGGENALLLGEYIEPIRSAGLTITKIIGPFESPINRYPMTNEDFKLQLIAVARRYLPQGLARLIGESATMCTWYGRYLTHKTNEPGRLYTFMGEKRYG
jgi:SAM-dependent methyltransferase